MPVWVQGGRGPVAVQRIITVIEERPVLFVTGEVMSNVTRATCQ